MLKIFKDKMTQDFMKISFGNILEWYDFSIYGLFAIQIAKAFFPEENGFIALLMVFLTFAAGFVARPLGSVIFGYIGDTHGKHYAVNLSIWCMAIPTMVVGFLPDYHSVGIIAPISLVSLRILQGLSTGGQFSGLLTIAVDSEAPHKTFLVSLVYAISVLGTLIASIIGLCFIGFSNKYPELSNMVWRFPFILSGILFLIYLKLRPKFKKLELSDKETFSLKQIFMGQPKELTFAVIMSTATGILYYVLFIYLITYLQLHLHIDKKYSFIFMNFILFISIILYAFFGYQGQWRKSRMVTTKKHVYASFIGILLLFLNSINVWFAVIGVVVLIINFCAIVGYSTTIFAEIFDKKYRMTACSINYSIGLTISGFSPLAAEILAKNFKYGLQYFLIATLVLLIFGINKIMLTQGYKQAKLQDPTL